MEEWNLDILLKYSIFFTLEMRNTLIRPWPFFTKYVLHETGGYKLLPFTKVLSLKLRKALGTSFASHFPIPM